ncbi:MAG: sigma 54-interacting transcriptional regulator, partial [Proteobacteria bacterium]|nr:sigma 54-interacting transcriptional regulator [Pseudomonadota bacterium]
ANTGLLAGDDDLLRRALASVESIASASLPEVPAMFLDQLRALGATLAGHGRVAVERLERLRANPHLSACPSLEARVDAMRALRMLDDLGDPEVALALARRSRHVAEAAQLAAGMHTALALRAEAEALMRLCRLDELPAVFAQSDRILDQLRFPVTIVLLVQSRYLLAMGDAAALATLAMKVGAIHLPSMRTVSQAFAAALAAAACQARGDDAATTMRAYDHAGQLCRGWSMERDLLVAHANAVLVDGDSIAEAREVLERAQRSADRRPAAWSTASLRRIEGTLLIREGRIDEGRTLVESAIATFEAAGDRLDAAIARLGAAGIDRLLAAPAADFRSANAEAELAAIGIPRPPWLDRELTRVAAALASVPPHRTPPPATPGLELAVQRLAVGGATRTMVLRELAAVSRAVAGTDVVVEVAATPHAGPIAAWFAIGNGMRLGLAVTPPPDVHAALRIVALVAGLALEVASLRGGERDAAPLGAELVELPGIVVASPAMRRVLTDVAQVASSRATVVITGESGAGKELVAR